MFWTLRRMYLEDKLPKLGLENAVAKNWITEAQMQEIIEAKEDSIEDDENNEL